MSHYARYYDEQIGGGGVRNVFAGSTFQRGRGVGAWLGGLFRRILPYVTSGAKAVGKETLRAGLKVVDDVANTGVNFKEAVKSRAKESGRNLKRKAADKISEIMEGSGYKTTVNGKRRRQSRKKRTRTRTAGSKKKTSKRKSTASKKKKKKKRKALRDISDIFGPK